MACSSVVVGKGLGGYKIFVAILLLHFSNGTCFFGCSVSFAAICEGIAMGTGVKIAKNRTNFAP